MPTPITDHPSLLFLEALMGHIDEALIQDPTLMCSRIENLLEDIIDLDCDLLLHTVDSPRTLLTDELKTRYNDVMQTCRRLGMYPDWLTPEGVKKV